MNQLWVEKWRPKTADEYVFIDDAHREQVAFWIKQKSIPHLLLSGGAGTGKTTLAKMLINELGIDEYDVLYANGSKEARGINWVDKLVSFCQTMPFGNMKIVLIDEADYMNKDSVQPALRNLMEEYSGSVRFILTCNFPNKILPPIHSRCQQLHITKTDHTEFTARVATILVTEGIEFDLDTLDTYVSATYPDLRKCLNLTQQNSTSGALRKPSEGDKTVGDWKLDCVHLFKIGEIKKARELLCSQAAPEEMEAIFRWTYDNLVLWGDNDDQQDEAILIIRRGLVNAASVGDQEINLSACLVELSQIRKQQL